jgi:hypothetical protein
VSARSFNPRQSLSDLEKNNPRDYTPPRERPVANIRYIALCPFC